MTRLPILLLAASPGHHLHLPPHNFNIFDGPHRDVTYRNQQPTLNSIFPPLLFNINCRMVKECEWSMHHISEYRDSGTLVQAEIFDACNNLISWGGKNLT